DSIRGKGSFEKAVNAIRTLRDDKIKTMIQVVLNKKNLSQLEPIIALAEKYDCLVQFQPVTVHKSDVKGNAMKYFPNKDELNKTVDWLVCQKKNSRPITNSIEYLNQLREYPENKIKTDCLAGKLFCAISPDGKVLPCCGLVGQEKNYASGLDIGFREAFNQLQDTKNCKGCHFAGYSELNLVLARPVKSFFIAVKNIVNKKWVWQ
ncbi:hypothetical protein ACFLZ6_00810, partial [Nanoarchaeota archaeon]